MFGTARAFKWNTPIEGRWNQMGTDYDMSGGNKMKYVGEGVSISADGTVALVGSPDGPGSAKGYRWNSTHWDQLGSDDDMIGDSPRNNLGSSASISNDGSVALLGCTGSSGLGGARAFRWNDPIPGKWNQLGSSGDFGSERAFSVSLSSDGTIALIGQAHYLSGTGIARAYRWNVPVAGKWNRLGSDWNNDMVGDVGDFAGHGVSLSADGKIALVGARFFDNSFTSMNRGNARLYKWNASSSRWDKFGSDTDMQVIYIASLCCFFIYV